MDAEKTEKRVKLILVDDVPLKFLARCIPEPSLIFNEYDQDIVRGMMERSVNYKLFDKSITYTNPVSYVKELYFLNATDVNSSQLLLALAKFPEAQIVLFLTKENEGNSGLSVVDTNYDELKVENWRKDKIAVDVPAPVTITIDATELVERFKKELTESVLNTI